MVRSMLFGSLQAIISQTLLKKPGSCRVVAHEIVIGTPVILHLTREDKADVFCHSDCRERWYANPRSMPERFAGKRFGYQRRCPLESENAGEPAAGLNGIPVVSAPHSL